MPRGLLLKVGAFVTSLGLVALLATPEVRAAEPTKDQKDQAVTKLVEGGELLKQGDYRNALVRFKEAYDLVPSPKIFYNFGLAYAGMGRNAAAVEAFERFLDEATDTGPDRRANAERQRNQLLSQIASLTVNCDTVGAEISVDGQSYGPTPRTKALRLDPGPHQLVVEKAGSAHFTQKLMLEAGTRLIVEVKLVNQQVEATPAPPVAQQPLPPAAPAPDSPPPPPNWRRRGAIGLGAVAVAALAFGAISRMGANSKYEEFNKAMPTNELNKCDADRRVKQYGGAECASLLADGDAAASRALVGFIAGGVLAAGAVTLFVLSNRSPEGQAHALACAPNLGTSGVTCALRF